GLKAEPIISWHSPKRLDVNSIRTFIQSIQGRAMGKVVMPAESFNDNLIALEACSSLNGIKRLIFCYGDKGRISRVLSPLFGSEWCYASLEPGKEGAPGQLDIMTMRKLQEAFL
ncbi:MAG: type I 3-dehydroquinate dehydratase, partial [Candidatus Methanomethylicus sp.]|nr:type I 3-dehydroquinate dehydratase [Candidatus Methanomethylicus sp.]